MRRGPVGSLGPPPTPEDFVRFEDRGISIYVHQELVPARGAPAAVLFYLGLKGSCRIVLS